MGFLRFLVWTSFCIGFGIFLATYEVNGTTPLEQAERIWKTAPAEIDGVLEEVRSARQAQPHEHHTADERAAINRLIAKQAPGR